MWHFLMMGIEEGIAVKQTFEIIIISRDNHTWQGTLKTDRGEVSFQSEFQLLLELEQLMGDGGRTEPSPGWERARGI